MYATDECTIALLNLQYTINDMDENQLHIPCDSLVKIYNDNNACLYWSKFTITQGIWDMTIR